MNDLSGKFFLRLPSLLHPLRRMGLGRRETEKLELMQNLEIKCLDSVNLLSSLLWIAVCLAILCPLDQGPSVFNEWRDTIFGENF